MLPSGTCEIGGLADFALETDADVWRELAADFIPQSLLLALEEPQHPAAVIGTLDLDCRQPRTDSGRTCPEPNRDPAPGRGAQVPE